MSQGEQGTEGSVTTNRESEGERGAQGVGGDFGGSEDLRLPLGQASGSVEVAPDGRTHRQRGNQVEAPGSRSATPSRLPTEPAGLAERLVPQRHRKSPKSSAHLWSNSALNEQLADLIHMQSKSNAPAMSLRGCRVSTLKASPYAVEGQSPPPK